jgi:hypothetical protein
MDLDADPVPDLTELAWLARRAWAGRTVVCGDKLIRQGYRYIRTLAPYALILTRLAPFLTRLVYVVSPLMIRLFLTLVVRPCDRVW